MAPSNDLIMEAVMNQMQVSWDKKRNEKEAKAIQITKKEIEKRFVTTAASVNERAKNCDATVREFTLKHATIDDEIRNLWIMIAEEQKSLLTLAVQRQKSIVDRAKKTEKVLIHSMARTKEATEDFKRLALTLET